MGTTPQSTPITPPFVPFLAFPLYCGEKACAELSPVAFKVYYYIARMTRGWKRDEAAISYEQFKDACGLKANSTISKALKELASKGFIAICKHGCRPSSYVLLDVAGRTRRAASAPRSGPAGTPVVPPKGARQTPPSQDPWFENEPWLAPFAQREARAAQVAVAEREEEASEAPPDLPGPLAELRSELDALTRQESEAYYSMVSRRYGTSEYQAYKEQLYDIRARKQQIRRLLARSL